MLKRFCLVSFLLFGVLCISGQYRAAKNLPRKIALLPEQAPRCMTIHFPNEADAYSMLPEQCSWYLNLDGIWNFTIYDELKTGKNFAYVRYDASNWGTTHIPYRIPDSLVFENNISSQKNNITTEVATQVIFSDTTNFVKKRNVLLLRKVIPIPEYWYGLQVFLYIENAMPNLSIWVNGGKIGQSLTGNFHTLWNITPYLVFGRINAIVLEANMADAVSNYFNNKFLSKAHLFAFPNVAISDFRFKTSNSVKGLNFDLEVYAKRYLSDIDDKFTIVATVYDRYKQPLFPPITKKFNAANLNDMPFHFSTKIVNYKLFNPDSANWYTLLISIRNKNNETVDVVKYWFGIREITKTDSFLIVNKNQIPFDSLKIVDKNTIHPYFIRNKRYDWLIFKLIIPKNINNQLVISESLKKQIVFYRNYTPIIAWQVEQNDITSKNLENIIVEINQLDGTRPVIVTFNGHVLKQ